MNRNPLSSIAMELENAIPCASESTRPDERINDQQPIFSNFSDHELYQDLIDQFVKGLEREIHDLDTAITDGNAQMIARLTHKVRGTAATFGYPAFAAVAEKMEFMAQSFQNSHQHLYDFQCFKILLNTMSTLHSRMLAALQQY